MAKWHEPRSLVGRGWRQVREGRLVDWACHFSRPLFRLSSWLIMAFHYCYYAESSTRKNLRYNINKRINKASSTAKNKKKERREMPRPKHCEKGKTEKTSWISLPMCVCGGGGKESLRTENIQMKSRDKPTLNLWKTDALLQRLLWNFQCVAPQPHCALATAWLRVSCAAGEDQDAALPAPPPPLVMGCDLYTFPHCFFCSSSCSSSVRSSRLLVLPFWPRAARKDFWAQP